MSTTSQQQTAFDTSGADALPVLEPGDHLDQTTFHARYRAMPEDVKAELIEGIVYMPAALGRPHGRAHAKLLQWLLTYEDATPGVEAYDNTTTILGGASQSQPDVCLIVLPDKGGQVRFTDGTTEDEQYLKGAPEFIGEIASSTESYDLHSKKRDYERAGVKEYLVVALRQKQVFWFANQNGRLHEIPRGQDGIYRSEVFPGLWLDPTALLALDGQRLMAVLKEGVSSPEHAAFVKSLAEK